MSRLRALGERLRLSLWFIPAVGAVLAAVAAAISLTIDARGPLDGVELFRFGGTADAARDVLATIAQSMLTFTGLVFTVTMLVLQLAANQLSPRVMRTFLRDRGNQVVLGLFVATFVFTLLVLREVRSSEAMTPFVPGLSIWVAFALLIASIAAFVLYINHMAHGIRASTVIVRIGSETREAIDRVFPDPGKRPAAHHALPDRRHPIGLVANEQPGTLIAMDTDGLVGVAREHGVAVAVLPEVGDFVPAGAPLYEVFSLDGHTTEPSDRLAAALREAASFGEERTLQQDVAFGFRQLVDVAVRALSPGTNDPTTAVQAIDQVHDLLRDVARRPFPDEVVTDEEGVPRVALSGPSFADFVALGCDELRLYGAGHLQVVRRLRDMLDDLLEVAPPERRGSVIDQLERLERGIARDFDDGADRAQARRPSSRGQGHADGADDGQLASATRQRGGSR